MEQVMGVFLFISMIMVILMTMLTFYLYLKSRDKRGLHMVEFWLAFGFNFTWAWLTVGEHYLLVAATLLFWIWRLRAFRLIMEDIVHVRLKRSWHPYVVVAGLAISLLMAALKASFLVVTFPLGLAIFIVTMHFLIQFVHGLSPYQKTMGRLFAGVVFVLHVNALSFSIVRYTSLGTYGYGMMLFCIFVIAVLLPSFVILEQSQEYSTRLEKLVEKRSQQLIYHSRFSALGEMAGGVAHEINNPLSIITGKADQLIRYVKKENELDKVLVMGLDKIENNAFRIANIINRLRYFSGESEAIPFEHVSLHSIIDDVLVLCREKFHFHGVKLEVAAVPDVSINCRALQISQVLLNVMNNAFDAVLDVPVKWIHMDFRLQQQKVLLSITDSGPGIPREMRDKIMQPFFTTKDIGHGTGLGLSVAKGIVEEHGGVIYLDEYSEHTRFTIELPYV